MENEIHTELKEIRGRSKTSGLDTTDFPMVGVPDLGTIADSCASMANNLTRHAKRLHGMASMQPNFDEQFSGNDAGLPSEGY